MGFKRRGKSRYSKRSTYRSKGSKHRKIRSYGVSRGGIRL